MRALATTAVLALGALVVAARVAAEPAVVVKLADGRRIPGNELRTGPGKDQTLDTVFGPLVIPRSSLRDGTTREAPEIERPPEQRRVTKSRWFVIENDLTDSRAALYRDQLDTFFDWMIGVYALDRKRLEQRAPFRAFVYRKRADFKRVQDEVAPGIAASKGQGFAEGVAGFFSPGQFATYLWDAEGGRGSAHLGVAKHETTHMLNALMAQQHALQIPVWFEEGAATYFSAATLSGNAKEPDDHPGALATVVDELERDKGMGNRELRSVPYATFYSREYSWGWALVRFLRHHKKGALWKPVLERLRSGGRGPPSDSYNKRFLKTVRFKTDAKLDEAWHAHLLAAKPGDGMTPVGASEEALAEVEALAKPTEQQARLFARLGESFAESGLPRPAVVYLRAAFRGGVERSRLHALLARALAESDGLAVDEPWPDESLEHLRLAAELDPLRAALRLEYGTQLLLHADTLHTMGDARDQLGLGLLVIGPDDDDIGIALGALRGQVNLRPSGTARDALAELQKLAPPWSALLERAFLEFLQEEQRFDEMLDVLRARDAAGKADFEQRAMLAGLLLAASESAAAADLYGKLLTEDEKALHLWPKRIESLVAAGRTDKARTERDKALAAIGAAPEDLDVLRRLIERIEIP